MGNGPIVEVALARSRHCPAVIAGPIKGDDVIARDSGVAFFFLPLTRAHGTLWDFACGRWVGVDGEE